MIGYQRNADAVKKYLVLPNHLCYDVTKWAKRGDFTYFELYGKVYSVEKALFRV